MWSLGQHVTMMAVSKRTVRSLDFIFLFVRNNHQLHMEKGGGLILLHILTLNFCILYVKYYIYIPKLFNSNKIDFLNFLTYLKQKINIEKQICSTEGRNEAFESLSLLLDLICWFRYICSIIMIIYM